MRRLSRALIVLAALALVPVASASQVVSTSTVHDLSLGVNSKGEAMVSYTKADGTPVHVLAFGAVNADPPVESKKQVAFTFQYDGGYDKYYTQDPGVQAQLSSLRDLQGQSKALIAQLRPLQAQERAATAAHNNPQRYAIGAKIKAVNDKLSPITAQINAVYAKLKTFQTAATDYWKTFTCPAYDGPALAWSVPHGACKAPDGSYWALQVWQRQLPDYGLDPTPAQAAYEVHLSHWTGDLPVLDINVNWAYKGKFDHLFGTFTYDGTGVYGFHSTPGGQPLDTWGRNLYVDTFDSAYGTGWKRDNSFLTHKPGGSFCYGFYTHGSHPVGKGTMYRATIDGPGVTPDVEWQGNAPGAYDQTAQDAANTQILALNDPLCKRV